MSWTAMFRSNTDSTRTLVSSYLQIRRNLTRSWIKKLFNVAKERGNYFSVIDISREIHGERRELAYRIHIYENILSIYSFDKDKPNIKIKSRDIYFDSDSEYDSEEEGEDFEDDSEED